MDLVGSIAQAIAAFEGFFRPGSLAARNNNPGNLRQWGNLPTSGGYAVFPSAEAGWAALRRQVALNISRGLSLLEFFGGKPGVYAGYAPAADRNQPASYAAFVGAQAGLPVDQPLNQLGAPAAAGVSVAPASPAAAGSDVWLVAALALAGVSVAVLLLG
jgi:hypothetical protein